ncbi:MAG: hypothetical protein FI737_14845 [SAR202 cluster bacterium]|jgi:hypothetical protein|nr:hypothetical protein [Acidobacteriota bacterium]MQF90331.1 hypothetical protein [SAR202 cluster bacterium]|tara:strand:- start:42 stop:446 length:405 start_codon:yes stop_codon:yes gene_type:complete
MDERQYLSMTQRAIVSVVAILLVSPCLRVDAAPQEGTVAPLQAVELPVNLERLKRKLAALPATDEERSLLKLNFYLEVYARAPRINPLEGFDIHTGPVPFGGPSDTDMRALWTPREFSTPAADLGSVLGWIFKR